MHGFHTIKCHYTATRTRMHTCYFLWRTRALWCINESNISLNFWMLVSNSSCHSRNSVLKLVALLLPCELRLQAYRAPTANHGCCGRNDALGENEKRLMHEHFTACNTQLRCARVVVFLCLCVSCVSVFLCLCVFVPLCFSVHLRFCVAVSMCRYVSVSMCFLRVYVCRWEMHNFVCAFPIDHITQKLINIRCVFLKRHRPTMHRSYHTKVVCFINDFLWLVATYWILDSSKMKQAFNMSRLITRSHEWLVIFSREWLVISY